MKITFDYLEKQGFESVTDYCRYLIENKVDFPPETKIEVYRGDMLCLTVNNIYDAAKLTVRENSKIGPVFVKHRPMTNIDRARLLKRSVAMYGQTVDALKYLGGR